PLLKRASAYSPVTAGRCEGRPRVGMRSATAESGGATSSSDRLSASAASNAATTAAATISTPPNRSGRPRELPPQAPTEPYLRLSPHTALHVPCQSTSLPEPFLGSRSLGRRPEFPWFFHGLQKADSGRVSMWWRGLRPGPRPRGSASALISRSFSGSRRGCQRFCCAEQ